MNAASPIIARSPPPARRKAATGKSIFASRPPPLATRGKLSSHCATLPAPLAVRFGARAGQRAWGRLVRIDHDGDRLVEGLELLAPD